MTLCAENLCLTGRLVQITTVLNPGTVTAICGPNGAGKSTLLSCLAGLVEPDSGAVKLCDAHLSSLVPFERARQIGYLPQLPEIAWDMNVETLVSLGRIPWGGASEIAAQAAIEDALLTMDLADLRNRPISQLSGGEKARALMARVLAGKPKWILADEPLANLDLAHAADLMQCLRRQAQSGAGVVLVLHDLAQAMNYADTVIVLNRGACRADDLPQTALSAELITQVWGVKTNWLGQKGSMALAQYPTMTT